MTRCYGLLLVLALCSRGTSAAAGGEEGSPISRVVSLMEGLSKKVQADGKAEDELFERYGCWYKTVVATKTASNEDATKRINALTSYIDDVESGRVEFTSERGDLTKQLAELNEEIEKSDNIRDKEHEDFLAAKDEMEKAIAALEEAVEVLGTTTDDMKEGELLSMKFNLRKVIALGKNVLSDKDARFLEKILDGETPTQDWKKLNRKATFKMKYKGRSFKIQEILADMLQTFQDNLAEAEQKESDASSFYEKLMTSKREEKETVEAAATDMSKETAARNLALEESKAEKENLEEQKSNDEGFIAETESAHSTMLEEFKERRRLRTEEIASISEAIQILSGDDARDTFKKSHESQAGLFLQKSARCNPAHRSRRAAAQLRKVGTATKSVRLISIATQLSLASGGHFDKVVEDLGNQIKALADEQTNDDETNDNCIKDRNERTISAKKLSQEIDDHTAEIKQNNEDIASLNEQIKATVTKIVDFEKELQEAKEIREAEHLAYEGHKVADQTAIELIESAAARMKKFYEDNGLSFAETSATAVERKAPEMSAAGEAPPAPPKMWSEPYGGAKGETDGIQGILEMIKEDTQKDMDDAQAEEDTAQSDFDSMKSDTFSTISDLEAEKADYEEEVANHQQTVTDEETSRGDKKDLLADDMNFLKELTPGCDYMVTNYEVRKTNRAAEMEGLEKAKSILEGASFLQTGLAKRC